MTKSIKKTAAAWFLVLSLLLSLLPSAALAASSSVGGTSGNITWTLNTQTGALTLSGTGAMTDYVSGYSPWLSYAETITSVVIQDGVTSIGNYAFTDCAALMSVTIPDSVTSIGNYAFSGCTALVSVTVPDSVTSIGRYAFYNCTALTEAVVSSNVTSLGSSVFRGCTGLTSATLNCDVLPAYAFYGCTGMRDVVLSGSPVTVGSYAFYGCTALTSIVLPETVTAIEEYAFCNCSYLISISFGSAVESVGSHAFYSGRLAYVYYGGTEEQWNAITFGDSNGNIRSGVTIYYNSAAHTHVHIDPVFSVSEDGESVTASFVCEIGDDTQTVDCDILSVTPVSDADCTEEGQVEYAVSCTFRDTEYSGTAIWTRPAVGHTYEAEFTWADSYTTCTARLVCSVCGGTTEEQTCIVSRSTTAAGTVYTASFTCNGETYTESVYAVTVSNAENGVVSVSSTRAAAGDTVTITTTPDEGYELASLNVTDSEGNEIAVTDYAFMMPADSVTVTAVFQEITSGEDKTYTACFTWSNDYSSATATLTSGSGGDTQTVTAVVTSQVIKAATCTATGQVKYTATATYNGVTYTEDKTVTTAATGHSWDEGEVTIPATRYTEGVRTYTCSCGASYTETIAKTGVTFLFTDVTNDSATYYTPVYWAYDHGITTGTTATTFSPSKTCTRAQFVTFLWRLAGEPEPENGVSPYTDVTDTSASYYYAVLWAAELGVTKGTSETTFSPSQTITRAQAVTFLYRYAGEPAVSASSSFTDVTNTSASYYDAVQWAVQNGITNGTTSTTFSPSDPCTRGQMVTFLYRFAVEPLTT